MPISSNKEKKILYVGMRYDYGYQHQGTSFEYNNFFRTLIRMNYSVIEFDFMTLLQQHGKKVMNSMLLETANHIRPDLIFFILFTDEIIKDTIQDLTTRFLTFNWFCDDHWRFNNYSRYYAPFFTFISTTVQNAIPKYHAHGIRNVLLTQWACNHYDYIRLPNAAKTFDVTFIGQPHGIRRKVVHRLQEKGICIDAFGKGWKLGRVSQQQMIHIINGSKINLNLSNSSLNIHTLFRNQQQIKGRNFEIPGCGGFLLSNYVEGIENYYDIGKEIICFKDEKELKERIQYYLKHDDQREAIALAGYKRTLREHTYEKRFINLFKQMGFTR
jgi:spore maturation protein CgeB